MVLKQIDMIDAHKLNIETDSLDEVNIESDRESNTDPTSVQDELEFEEIIQEIKVEPSGRLEGEADNCFTPEQDGVFVTSRQRDAQLKRKFQISDCTVELERLPKSLKAV